MRKLYAIFFCQKCDVFCYLIRWVTSKHLHFSYPLGYRFCWKGWTLDKRSMRLCVLFISFFCRSGKLGDWIARLGTFEGFVTPWSKKSPRSLAAKVGVWLCGVNTEGLTWSLLVPLGEDSIRDYKPYLSQQAVPDSHHCDTSAGDNTLKNSFFFFFFTLVLVFADPFYICSKESDLFTFEVMSPHTGLSFEVV